MAASKIRFLVFVLTPGLLWSASDIAASDKFNFFESSLAVMDKRIPRSEYNHVLIWKFLQNKNVLRDVLEKNQSWLLVGKTFIISNTHSCSQWHRFYVQLHRKDSDAERRIGNQADHLCGRSIWQCVPLSGQWHWRLPRFPEWSRHNILYTPDFVQWSFRLWQRREGEEHFFLSPSAECYHGNIICPLELNSGSMT